MFRRSSTHYGKTPEPETPYQKAAQVWDERIGSARVQARSWPSSLRLSWVATRRGDISESAWASERRRVVKSFDITSRARLRFLDRKPNSWQVWLEKTGSIS